MGDIIELLSQALCFRERAEVTVLDLSDNYFSGGKEHAKESFDHAQIQNDIVHDYLVRLDEVLRKIENMIMISMEEERCSNMDPTELEKIYYEFGNDYEDGAGVKEHTKIFERLLSELPIHCRTGRNESKDNIINACCNLNAEHEKQGFINGFKYAMKLNTEMFN